MDTETTLNLLSTVRHEWMNRLQVISLYATMEPDRLGEVYERYRLQADAESALSRLGCPNTALTLIRANWEGRVEYTIECARVHIEDDVLAAHFTKLFASTDQAIHVTFTDGIIIRVSGKMPKEMVADADVLEETEHVTVYKI